MRKNVKEFYNEFSKSTLNRDFKQINLRHTAIKHLISKYLGPNHRVLEIGCGAGIITRFIAKRVREVLAVDISDVNIETARRYVQSSNCNFASLDITTPEAWSALPSKFDVVILADVIEHIPLEKHEFLFGAIRERMVESGWLILTFPSPEFQTYLSETSPAELQIVDEQIEIAGLLSNCPLHLNFFSYCPAWDTNQYVHAVFMNGTPSIKPIIPSFWCRIYRRTANWLWSVINLRHIQ